MAINPAKVMPMLSLALATGRVTSYGSAVESPNAAWSGATTYAVDQLVSVLATHREYKSLQAANLNKDPATNPTWWLDMGPSNKYAMFDGDRNTATVAASPFTVQITPGQRITGLAMFGVTADRVDVVMTVLGVTVYSATLNLLARNSTRWSEYFFGPFVYRESAVFFDIPAYVNGVLSVTFTRATGNVSVETLAVGQPQVIGGAKLGASSDVLDFSRIDRDAFGNATLVRRKNVPVVSMQILVDKTSVSRLRKLRDDLAAQPAVWAGISDSSDGYFDSLAMLGIFKRMPIVIEYPTASLINLELEGL